MYEICVLSTEPSTWQDPLKDGGEGHYDDCRCYLTELSEFILLLLKSCIRARNLRSLDGKEKSNILACL